jgi:hypothetical protein
MLSLVIAIIWQHLNLVKYPCWVIYGYVPVNCAKKTRTADPLSHIQVPLPGTCTNLCIPAFPPNIFLRIGENRRVPGKWVLGSRGYIGVLMHC